ncbi:Uma2 family endonuclease [Anthocerotibacter panamensis]|uniref:Uma2 family endonuclease n=1 Tax=Anthocerotibacter panamensis TaxID=2857077 RepID=UPI001C401518|nr:Uma2 family endonuclease [Anthocerotibacter panamensis]
MVSAGTKLTLEAFLALPAGDVTYELVDGQAVPKVSPQETHSILTFTLTTLLSRWAKFHGRVRLEWALALKRRGEDWAPVPDVTYISYERLPASVRRTRACPVPPELVLEILSPGQTIQEFENKAQDYFAAGVLRMWLVEPDALFLQVFFPDRPSQIYTGDIPITDPLFPGLSLSIKEIFEEAELL